MWSHVLLHATDKMNALVQAWSAWMWDMSWHVTWLVALLWILGKPLKHTSARFRFALWCLVLARLVTPPSLALPTSIGWWLGDWFALHAPSLPLIEPAEGNRTATASIAQSSDATVVDHITGQWLVQMNWPALLFALWLGFALAQLAWMLLGWWQIWLWLGQSQSLDDADNQQTLAAAKRRVGITGYVDLRDCGRCTTPLVIGCFRPTILLPTVVRESLTPAELETVLVHELTHVARGDGWWRVVQALLGSIYFFHPAIWLARYKLNQLCEEACDEQTVFALAGERRDYAQAIVKAATIIGYQPPHLAMRMMSNRLPVKKRLQRILDPALPWSAAGSWQRALLIVLLACVLLPSGYRSSEATIPSQMRQLGLPTVNVIEDVDAQLAALQVESPDASRDEELEQLALEQVQSIDLDTRLQGYQTLERVGTLRSLRDLEAAFLSRRGLEQDAAKRALDHVWSIIRQLPTEPIQTSRQILND